MAAHHIEALLTIPIPLSTLPAFSLQRLLKNNATNLVSAIFFATAISGIFGIPFLYVYASFIGLILSNEKLFYM
jgi:hypothetical protein